MKIRQNPAKAWLRALESVKILRERPSLTLPVLVQELGARHGAKPALLGEFETLSYQGLANRAAHYAEWAASCALAPGEVVGLLMPNSPEYAAIWLGITRSGGVVALLNVNLRGDALLHCLQAANCSHVIVSSGMSNAIEELRDELPGSTGYWVHGKGTHGRFGRIDAAETWPTRCSEIQKTYNASQNDLALLIFTSGTTGLPKAAKVTHGRVLEWSTWFAGMMDTKPSDRLYNCLPMYHSIGGVVAVGAMLTHGGSVVIRERFSATEFWDDVVRHECTIFQYIGELCRYLVLAGPQPAEAQHQLRLCCGNGMRGEVWTAFQARFKIPQILEFYAATEGNVSLYNCEGKPGAIGRVPAFLSHSYPVALVECNIDTGELLRDEFGHCIPCAEDQPGEAIGRIQATAESQFDGYTDTKASAAKTITDVFSPGDRWFRTGDLMRKDSAGYYYFVDRLGDSFRWKGENVASAEIAEILGGCEGIEEAVVFGVAVPGNEGKAGMAAITTTENFCWSNLQAYLKQHLPSYARPIFVRLCQSLEATGTFKFKKNVLQADGYLDATEPVWVYDNAVDAFVLCGATQLEWIADGGIGRKPALNPTS